MEKKLSFIQTMQLAWWEIPSFKTSVMLALAGILVTAAFAIIPFPNNKWDLIALAGALISYAGFDQISKIVTGLKDATISDYEESAASRKNGKGHTEG